MKAKRGDNDGKDEALRMIRRWKALRTEAIRSHRSWHFMAEKFPSLEKDHPELHDLMHLSLKTLAPEEIE